MRILITGGTGMVGRNIAENDFAKSHQLLTPNRKELDLTNKLNVRKWLQVNKPEFIIHAAGLVGGIHANIANQSGFLLNNMFMGCNLISEASKLGIKNIINIGSSCMYPKNAENPLKEESLFKGILEPTNEGYALAKLTIERLCNYLKEEDNTRNYITIMPCNLYGIYDNFNPKSSHLIPSIIVKIHNSKINNQKNVSIWGDGTAKREFMYVKDLSNAIWFCVPRIDRLPNLINIGVGKDLSIKQYYEKVAEIIGYGGSFSYDLKKPIGMKRKLLDVRKINNMGWKSQYSLDLGISRTYDYFLNL